MHLRDIASAGQGLSLRRFWNAFGFHMQRPLSCRGRTWPARSQSPGSALVASHYDRCMSSQSVIDRFVENGRLLIMPTKRAKRLLVLDHFAQSFEPGRTYLEAEVNEVLGAFYDDYAALRRYLVDEVFLTRENGVYWRSGGTVSA